MKFRKSLVAIPLSMSLILPATTTVSFAAEKPSVMTPAVELRTTLDHLLTEHAYLAVEAMRKGAEGAKDFDASAQALNANADDLAKAISSVYGDEAGKQFDTIWKNHIGYFVNYVKATGANDQAKKDEALKNLANYKNDFSKFLEKATGKRLEAASLAEGLQMHINQLIGAFDSYVAGDYDKAYKYEHEAMDHMGMVAKGLSNAITMQFPDKFNNTMAVTPAADLRSTLNHLLTEHAGLAVSAMQNGLDGSKDFQASADALAANTDALTKAISSVYGGDAGQQFKKMWSEHIGYFVDYTKAEAAGDQAKMDEAIKHLDNYRSEFSKFLGTATDGRVDPTEIANGLQTHVEQLTGALDNYKAGNYNKEYDQIREAYAHMLNPAKGLSAAFVDQFPDKFMGNMPSQMPKTGMGGTSQQHDQVPFEWILAGLFAAAGATTLALQKKKANQQ
ncbi:copper amine oxidase [Falsibacillus albus]|uniref:Copper amine oxidase n=1 Tax=Falsibacillus albus TaxID=2478915 RepID=A0A3L7JU10_9BACI|nr:copper amine oxidase [Falsibacillus albus]RLQ93111.1 copper amine oxidase [Falsibacillus albus]